MVSPPTPEADTASLSLSDSLQCQLYWTLDHPGNTLVGVSQSASERLDLERRPRLNEGITIPSHCGEGGEGG